MKIFLTLIAFLATIAGANANRQRLVLKYDHSVDLEDVAEAVKSSGAKVERQLGCTRGILISVDGQGRQALDEVDGMVTVPIDEAHRVRSRRRLNGINTPQGNGNCDHKETCENLLPSSVLTQNDVDLIKTEIRQELLKGAGSFDGSLGDNAGAIMRLVFHDAASFVKNDAASLSGLNGCVNKDNTGNAGLHNVQAWLENLQEFLFDSHTIDISIADLSVLAAITALEVTTDKAKEVSFGHTGELDIEFKYGRPDISCDCENDFEPESLTTDGSNFNFENIDHQMRDGMGFTRKEIVALMGTHTLGAMTTETSGFPAFLKEDRGVTKAFWLGFFTQFGIAESDGFDNGYYRFMLNYPWNRRETVVDGVTMIEWVADSLPLVYLNSDAALAFQIDFTDEDGNLCNRFGGFNGCIDEDNPALPLIPGCILCPELNNAYGQFVREYDRDQARWLSDYSKAFQKMIDDMVPCRGVQLMAPSQE